MESTKRHEKTLEKAHAPADLGTTAKIKMEVTSHGGQSPDGFDSGHSDSGTISSNSDDKNEKINSGRITPDSGRNSGNQSPFHTGTVTFFSLRKPRNNKKIKNVRWSELGPINI